ncbi:hypothetical protein [Mesorhizobium australicum]|uniref:hypothetical protein n=1 Tax=Mesorhizobium australicum TaxID=536018 RepID=UPI003EB88907
MFDRMPKTMYRCQLFLSVFGLLLLMGDLLHDDKAMAQQPCPADHDRLLTVLKANVKASGGPANGGFETNEWGAIVARDGTVCAIAFSGPAVDSQWPGSRLIAAEKANTANGLSLAQMALSTANLYAGVQPGGPLFGLQATNPVNQAAAYAGDPKTFGSANDPLVGKPIGGVVVFGGAWPFTTAKRSSARLASVAIPLAPTTMSPGAFARLSTSTRSRQASIPTVRMPSSMISIPAEKAPPAGVTRCARAPRPTSRRNSVQASEARHRNEASSAACNTLR